MNMLQGLFRKLAEHELIEEAERARLVELVAFASAVEVGP